MSPTPICSGTAPAVDVRQSADSPEAAASASRAGQEGFTLAALIVILTIISLVIAYTVPEQWSLVMRRERERQTIFLMKQYARGIMEWQRKHNAAPVSLDQLKEAREPRLLRGGGEWINPLTGSEEDWILVPPGAIQAGGAPVPMPPTAGGSNPVTAPPQSPRAIADPTTGAPLQATPGQPSRLNPDASPADYIGPFIGVRPNAKGRSLLSLNGAEDYGEWVYTVQDLQRDIMMRQAALAAR